MMSLMISDKKRMVLSGLRTVVSLTSAGGPGGRGLGSPVRGGVRLDVVILLGVDCNNKQTWETCPG